MDRRKRRGGGVVLGPRRGLWESYQLGWRVVKGDIYVVRALLIVPHGLSMRLACEETYTDKYSSRLSDPSQVGGCGVVHNERHPPPCICGEPC